MAITVDNNEEQSRKKNDFIIRKISSEDDVALLPRLQHTKSVVAVYAESIRRQRSDSFVHSSHRLQQPINNESRISSIYQKKITDSNNKYKNKNNIDIKHSNQDNLTLHAKILSAAIDKPSSSTLSPPLQPPTLHINTSISTNTNNKETGAILEGVLIRRAIRPASLLTHNKEDSNNSSPSSATSTSSSSSSNSSSPEELNSLPISISSSTISSTITKESSPIITPPPIHSSTTTSSLSNDSMLQHPWEPPSLISCTHSYPNLNAFQSSSYSSSHSSSSPSSNYHHQDDDNTFKQMKSLLLPLNNNNNNNNNSNKKNEDNSTTKQHHPSLFKRLAQRHHHGLNLTRDDISSEDMLYPPSTPTLDKDTELDRYGFQKATQWVPLETYHDFENQYQPVLDRRRLKWQQLLDENESKLPDRCTQIKRYIRKGIPSHLRGRVWLHYSGAEAKMDANPGVYEKFLKRAIEMGTENEFSDLIERDLHRTFPDNIQFSKAIALATTPTTPSSPSSTATTTNDPSKNDFTPPAIDVLRRVLCVFSVYCPSVGYCQSLNYLVGMLLLFMKEEEAFWCLVTIVQNILPAGVYDVTMEGSSIDQTVLMMLLHERMPQFWYKLTNKSFWEAEADGVSMPTITLVTSHWFLTLFINILPTESMLRIWDCFFYEGSNALFRVSLTLFKMCEPFILDINDPLEIFQVVQNFPKRIIDCQLLMDCAYRKYANFTDVSNEELDRRREICRELRKARRSMTPSELAANRSKYDQTPRKRWKLIVNPSSSHHILRK